MTTNPDYLALLAAVCAAPDDDAPRLVLADWLDEHGEPERAEFIRVQVELGRIQRLVREQGDRAGPAAAIINGLADRERELLSEPRHFVNWTPAILHTGRGAGIRCDNSPVVGLCGKGFHSAIFRRGFIEVIDSDAAEWLGHGDLLSWDAAGGRPCPPTAQPITEVRLADPVEATFGPVRRQDSVPLPGEGVSEVLRATWTAEPGGRVFGATVTIHPDDYVGGRHTEIRREFERRIELARTEEGYLRMRWPSVRKWDVPRLDPAYELGRGLARRQDERFMDAFLRGARGAPVRPDPRAMIPRLPTG